MSAYKDGSIEKPYATANGIAMLLLLLALAAAEVFIVALLRNPVLIITVAFAVVFIAPGFFMLQPNEAGSSRSSATTSAPSASPACAGPGPGTSASA